jgi:hypothetical protein
MHSISQDKIISHLTDRIEQNRTDSAAHKMAQKREPCRKEGTEWKSGIMASEDVDANQPMRETAERRVGKFDIISIMPGIGVTRPLVATKGRARWALCVSSLRQAVRVDWSSFFFYRAPAAAWIETEHKDSPGSATEKFTMSSSSQLLDAPR